MLHMHGHPPPAFLLGYDATAPFAAPTHALAECASTMDEAWRLVQAGELDEPFSAVLTACQTGGRGQLRRPWSSAPGNLHLSVVLPPLSNEASRLSPLLVGLCMARLLGIFDERGVHLKWPNDLLQVHRGAWRKVGGILLEERAGRLVAGIGVNMAWAPPAMSLERSGAFTAGVLQGGAQGGAKPVGPLAWWQGGGQRFAELFMDASQMSGNALAAQVRARMALLGERVQVRDTGMGDVTGRLVGVNAAGELLLEEVAEAPAVNGAKPRNALETALPTGAGGQLALYSGTILPL